MKAIYRLGKVVRIDDQFVTVNVERVKDFDFLSPGIEDIEIGSYVCIKYINGFAQIESVFHSVNQEEVLQEFFEKYPA